MNRTFYLIFTMMAKVLSLTFVTAYLSIYANRRLNAVSSYMRLSDALELPSVVKPSQLVLFTLGTFVPIWNAVFFIAGLLYYTCCNCCSGLFDRHDVKTAFLAFLGTVDLLLALGLIAGIAMQSTFLPGTMAGCRSYHGPAAVQDMLKREAVARTAKQKPLARPITSNNVCRDFVGVSILATCTIVVLLIAAMLAIFKPSWKVMKVIFKVALWIPKAIWFPFKIFFWVLVRIPPSTAYCRRYLNQWRQSKNPVLEISTNDTIHGLKLSNMETSPKSKFEKTLSNGSIALCLVHNSHFAEVAKLCQTSKHLRSVLLKAGGPGNQNISSIRSLTCQPGTKGQCWGCDTQICEGCSVRISPGIPQTTTHLTFCEPRCPQCYFGRVLEAKLRSKACYHSTSLVQNAVRTVCTACSKLPPTELLGKREAKEAQEIFHLSKSQLRCGECKRKFSPKGSPIWWVCTNCQGECHNSHHSSWYLPQK
ncbi:hypothetical protein B0J11DRAFT_274340 [Dendryphion nanum]|uniref:Uncharacterized protein n=1 Tax=Dendryphion nanum TaxID=256645 RepID=A0A9P9E0U9_9PLEO|nr:hypothetical protein B0J11DRAFT_274340 [Dendryphion nanum]